MAYTQSPPFNPKKKKIELGPNDYGKPIGKPLPTPSIKPSVKPDGGPSIDPAEQAPASSLGAAKYNRPRGGFEWDPSNNQRPQGPTQAPPKFGTFEGRIPLGGFDSSQPEGGWTWGNAKDAGRWGNPGQVGDPRLEANDPRYGGGMGRGGDVGFGEDPNKRYGGGQGEGQWGQRWQPGMKGLGDYAGVTTPGSWVNNGDPNAPQMHAMGGGMGRGGQYDPSRDFKGAPGQGGQQIPPGPGSPLTYGGGKPQYPGQVGVGNGPKMGGWNNQLVEGTPEYGDWMRRMSERAGGAPPSGGKPMQPPQGDPSQGGGGRQPLRPGMEYRPRGGQRPTGGRPPQGFPQDGGGSQIDVSGNDPGRAQRVSDMYGVDSTGWYDENGQLTDQGNQGWENYNQANPNGVAPAGGAQGDPQEQMRRRLMMMQRQGPNSNPYYGAF